MSILHTPPQRCGVFLVNLVDAGARFCYETTWLFHVPSCTIQSLRLDLYISKILIKIVNNLLYFFYLTFFQKLDVCLLKQPKNMMPASVHGTSYTNFSSLKPPSTLMFFTCYTIFYISNHFLIDGLKCFVSKIHVKLNGNNYYFHNYILRIIP